MPVKCLSEHQTANSGYVCIVSQGLHKKVKCGHAPLISTSCLLGTRPASAESLLGGSYQVLLPRLYLIRAHLEVFGEFGQRVIVAYGDEESYFRLKGCEFCVFVLP